MAPPAKTWRPVDTQQLLPAVDQELVARFAGAVQAAGGLTRRLPATLHVMRDNQAGQPRAAAPDAHGERVAWCWDHERTVAECDRAGLTCVGEIIAGASDPTGEAATVSDRAEHDRRALARALVRAATAVQEAVAITSAYPVVALVDEDQDPSPGEDLCRCCWKVHKYPKLIERKADGTPYYKGLCRWCGQMRRTLRGDRLGKVDPAGDPPTWLVANHLDGTVTQGMVDKAQREIDAKVAKRAKTAKGKKRRR